jgi:amino acid adenylation domain-containing protein
MGVLYSGNFYVPVDTKTPLERLRSIIQVLNPVAIVGFTEMEFKLVQNLHVELPYYSFENLVSHPINNENLDIIRNNAIDLDPAYAIFTSGSTGVPKAVAISHRSVIDLSHWLVRTFSFDSTDVIGNQTPFYFDASVKDIYLSLRCSATLVVIPQKCFSFPQLLLETLQNNQVTTLLWATSAVVMTAKSEILPELQLSSLRRVFFAGEAMFGKHLNIWKESFPNCTYINLYGPTEVTVDSTYYVVNRSFKDNEVVPIGSNCDNKRVFILDENNHVLFGKSEGELAVDGSGVALGYYNNLEQNIKAFIQNPLHNHYAEIIYKTGDFVRINDFGEIEFVGRKDFQVKHMGNRIELGEIEAAVYGLAQVKHAACVYDTEQQKIVLFYTSEEEISAATFLKELSLAIPKYMYPNKFIYLNEMPLNANSKVNKKLLSELYL